MTVTVLLLTVLLFSVVLSDQHKTLPLVYQIEDFHTCLNKDYVYCKSDAMLQCTGSGDNYLWTLINNSTKDRYSFARNLIHRGICIPRKNASDLESIKEFARQKINNELKEDNLVSSIKQVSCITKNDVKMSAREKNFWAFLIIYLFFVLCATIYDISKRSNKNEAEGSGDKIITSFSLISNWKKICKTKGDEDYTKLKSIQGIRVLMMLMTVIVHSLLSFNVIYILNPEEMEKIFSFTATRILATFAILLVQTFLLVSSWLVTIQIHNHYREHGQFTLKEVFIMLINRFVRLGVCSTVMIGILQVGWIALLDGPISFDNTLVLQKACIDNWWQTFIFVNNGLPFGDMCHPITWYLSADFQLYVMTLITLYVILKFKLCEWRVIGFLVFLSLVLYGSVIYANETGAVWQIGVNTARKYYFAYSPEANILYLSTYSSWTTSLVGISFGIIYVKNKNRKIISNNIVFTPLWALIFFGFPSLVMFSISFSFHGITSAILGPLMKPLFVTGIAVGILGMSHNIGGVIKRILENDYVAVISNFSYSVYIFQTLLIFSKGMGSNSLIKLDVSQMILHSFFVDVPLTLVFGMIGAFLIEQPGISLQKILLPQLPRGAQQSQKKK